jgi:nitroimidazol reductase NimA-like FMN-containing flavoprotein (pyridoxamine 5'-phosphate oxidase superfamily)
MSSNKMTTEDIEDLFETAYTVTFCTHNKDGTIHAAPIWYRYKDGVFYFASIKKARRVYNIKRNNKVSLMFLEQGTKVGEEGNNPSKCALVYGKAEMGFVPEEGYNAFAKWVFGKYAPPGSEHNPEFNQELFITIKVMPDNIVHFYP